MSVEACVSADLATGSVFAGRYCVERRIALGGMGAVYEVVHIETNRRRALKVMHAHYVSSDELRMRFRQEARVAAQIESEHIVDVFDAGVDDATGMPFLVMELLRGEDLGRLSKRVGPLPKEDVVQYLYETSLALDKTHRARIVHRDLKPDNLFLCEREHGPPRVKVLDFGIAKIVKDAETTANATRSLGTPLYMAPEQFQLKGAISPATDIFALGMIAFTLLVGKAYWYHESTMASEVWAFAMHVATGPKESAVNRAWELFGVELPKAFDGWFFQATARDPSARFTSSGEAVLALAEVLGVASPAIGFVAKNAKTVLAQQEVARPAAPSTLLIPSTGHSSPRTGPTMLAMTPQGDVVTREKRRPRPLILIGTGGAFLTGLGFLLIARVMTIAPGREIPASSVAQPPLEHASAAHAVVSNAALVPTVSIEPVPSGNPAMTVSPPSASSGLDKAPANSTANAKTSEKATTNPTTDSTVSGVKVPPKKAAPAKQHLGWERF